MLVKQMNLACLLAFCANTACFTITNISIGQKTALERQLIGEFEPLTDEEILASSVRAAATTPLLGLDDAQARALSARQRQLYNRDDIGELKAAGCLGEGYDAKLAGRSCAAAKDEATRKLIDRLLAEENSDRIVVIDWVAGAQVETARVGRNQLVDLYHRLLLEQSRPGDWIEETQGAWHQR